MMVTKLAAGAGLVLLGLLCWLAAAGFTAMTALLVTGAALVVLVGGGNWLGGRTSPSAARRTVEPDQHGGTEPPEAGLGNPSDRSGVDAAADAETRSDSGPGSEAGPR